MSFNFTARYIKKCFLGLFGLILLVLIGFVDFVREMKSPYMWSRDSLERIKGNEKIASGEIIVVLTGGNGRVATGLELLKDSNGSVLIISGVNENAGMSSIFANYNLGDLKGRIFLEKQSTSTYENAIEVSDMIDTLSVLRGGEISSLTLVTSPYHMYRASYTFKNILPPDMKIVSNPTVDREDFLTNWYSDGGFVSGFKEYIKTYFYYVKLYFK